jgi:hypothetical protein
MENLKIKGASDTFFTPDVDFDAARGVCQIAGESYLENTTEFYKQLMNWLQEYMKSSKPIDFHLRLAYYNTSSNKAILKLLLLLKSYEDSGAEVKVTWHYNSDDDEMKEEAEDYALDSGLKIEILGDLVVK